MATAAAAKAAKYNKAKTVKELIYQIAGLGLPADRVMATPGLGPEQNITKLTKSYFDMALQATSVLAKTTKKFDENGVIVAVPMVMDTALASANGITVPMDKHYQRLLEALDKAARKGKSKDYDTPSTGQYFNLNLATTMFTTTGT